MCYLLLITWLLLWVFSMRSFYKDEGELSLIIAILCLIWAPIIALVCADIIIISKNKR